MDLKTKVLTMPKFGKPQFNSIFKYSDYQLFRRMQMLFTMISQQFNGLQSDSESELIKWLTCV